MNLDTTNERREEKYESAHGGGGGGGGGEDHTETAEEKCGGARRCIHERACGRATRWRQEVRCVGGFIGGQRIIKRSFRFYCSKKCNRGTRVSLATRVGFHRSSLLFSSHGAPPERRIAALRILRHHFLPPPRSPSCVRRVIDCVGGLRSPLCGVIDATHHVARRRRGCVGFAAAVVTPSPPPPRASRATRTAAGHNARIRGVDA